VTRQTSSDRAVRLLREVGIARTSEFEHRAVSRTELRRLHERGIIERVGRGLYTLPGAVLTERHSLAEACRRVPRGVLCLLTALRLHGLTTQNPSEVWIAIDRKAWRPRQGSPRLRLIHMSGASFREGVEEHDVGGVRIRVYGAAKTVADCFKFRNKIGLDVAVEALRDYRRLHPKKLGALWRFAEMDRVTRVMQPYLETLALATSVASRDGGGSANPTKSPARQGVREMRMRPPRTVTTALA
jgi:predicted transcriptional regulator of viral defense system